MTLLIPSAAQCWSLAGPILAVVGVIWFLRNGDQAIDRLFPHLEWERKLGWLNARADRRAKLIMRGMQHLLHVFLLLALAGVLALSWLVGHRDTDTPLGVLTLADEFGYIGVCLSPWIYYFVVVLGPRLQAEFEEQELARYRAENPETDNEEEREGDSTRSTAWQSRRPRRY
jgi:hypothetical protein